MPARRRSRAQKLRERLRLAARRNEVYTALKARPCADCGVQYPPYVMHFDHLPGHTKRKDVSAIKSAAGVVSEALKCDLVCANCHAVRTWTRKQHLTTEPQDLGPTLFD